jgi:hypothetical protein
LDLGRRRRVGLIEHSERVDSASIEEHRSCHLLNAAVLLNVTTQCLLRKLVRRWPLRETTADSLADDVPG